MRARTVAAALCLSMLAFACARATPEKSDVTIKNFSFGPNAITVAAGTTVTWHNSDGEPHTVVSADGLFRSAALDTGEAFSFKFTKPGTFKYVCTIHPRMVASVIVK
ncbi:MAG TPA: cupredoxin family copper-binding protein [Rhizomicrobium sp.]|nr:cupredoxin family copper-binding protein [Rhizomicrobium sp.]